MPRHFMSTLFVIDPYGVILVRFPILQNVVSQDGERNLFAGQEIKKILRVCTGDNKAAYLIAALQDFWQVEFLPRNIGTVVKGEKEDRVIIRRTECFSPYQHSRVKRMQKVTVTQKKGDWLRQAGLFNFVSCLCSRVFHAFLDLKTDSSGAVQNARHRRGTYSSKTR